MALCTTLQNKVLDLEKTKTTQDNKIASLKRMVKKLEKKNRSRTHKLKRLYKVGLTARVESSNNEESFGEDAPKYGMIDAIDADEEITLVKVVVKDVNNEVNVVEEVVEVINPAKLITDATTISDATTTTTTITTVNDITLVQALMEIKSIKPKEKGVVIQELGESTTTISSQLSQDTGKGILIEPVKPMKKKDQIRHDEETTSKLQAQEQEQLSIEEKATLFQQLLEKRRKHFAAKRAEEKRNKPPTKVQQRKIMCTYWYVTDINKKDKNQAKMDKTEHGMERA
ncbi:hypothetical protein Tco_1573201 [Tanacetum coccineum]